MSNHTFEVKLIVTSMQHYTATTYHTIMRNSLLSLIFITTMSACSSNVLTPQTRPNITIVQQKLTPVELARRMTNETVALCDGQNEQSAHVYCTATWISKTELLTAAHCVEDTVKNKIDDFQKVDELESVAYYYTAEEYRGFMKQPSSVHVTRVTALDRRHDIAMLTMLVSAPEHGFAKFAKWMPDVGERVYGVGHPHQMSWTFVEGIVSAYREKDFLPAASLNNAGPYMQLAIPIASGMSGGGAFNERGEYIGVAVFGNTVVPMNALYVYIDTVKTFVNSAKK